MSSLVVFVAAVVVVVAADAVANAVAAAVVAVVAVVVVVVVVVVCNDGDIHGEVFRVIPVPRARAPTHGSFRNFRQQKLTCLPFRSIGWKLFCLP